MSAAMREYLNLRASETLGQEELVAFLENRFPKATRPIGRQVIEGTKCVETRVRTDSQEFREIASFVDSRRARGQKHFEYFPIASYLRKYTKDELRNAEALTLNISSYFEPSGEECGTIYETLCKKCNLGRQVSDLILDLRFVPQRKDMGQTIAKVEWIVSSRFVQAFREQGLTGAEFRSVFEFKHPTRKSKDWHQLWITGKAGKLSEETTLGKDAFSPSQIDWRCPLGHSVATDILSEIFLQRETLDGSDIAISNDLFGQGRNLLRPTPLIVISPRLYQLLCEYKIKGFSCEIARVV